MRLSIPLSNELIKITPFRISTTIIYAIIGVRGYEKAVKRWINDLNDIAYFINLIT